MRIVIYHFYPIELYPPVLNLLKVLEEKINDTILVTIFTTKPDADFRKYESANKNIEIKRFGKLDSKSIKFLRYLNYFKYFVSSLILGIFPKPERIIYFETISSIGPLIIKKIYGKRSGLFIHYHEYMTTQEYRGMYLNKLFHSLEKKMYPVAKWISHTNQYRMDLFLKDIELPYLNNTNIFPNYPLSDFKNTVVSLRVLTPVRLVYVGSFGSMEDIYIEEMLEWIKHQNGNVTLDIYSFNITASIKSFVKNLVCPYINVFSKVDYFNLPHILKNYDVGLVLYKGTSNNVIYCVSNKLFEYLACGLDVWYPEEMIGTHEFDSEEYWPKVLRLNYKKLADYSLLELVHRAKGKERNIDFTYEKASEKLVRELILEVKNN